MIIEQPRFPTPEDERRASLLWQAVCDLADDHDFPPVRAPDVKERKDTSLAHRR